MAASTQSQFISIHQDVNLYAALLNTDKQVVYPVASGRVVWIQVVRGAISLNGQALTAGDGAAISEVNEIDIQGAANRSEILLFDMVA